MSIKLNINNKYYYYYYYDFIYLFFFIIIILLLFSHKKISDYCNYVVFHLIPVLFKPFPILTRSKLISVCRRTGPGKRDLMTILMT